MTERRFVKPNDRLVRHPETLRPLAPAGEWVTWNTDYWERRLQAGDVIEVEAPDGAQE